MRTENEIENGAAVETAPDSPTAPAEPKRRTAPPSMPPKASAPDTPPETAADGASAKPAKKPPRRAKAKKRGARASQAAPAATETTATEGAPPRPAKKAGAKKAGGRAKAAATGGSTLTDVAAGFLAHLEAEGCSMGTVSGYRGELVVAAGFLGGDTLVADLTPECVAEYFACDRVTKTRAGEEKSARTVAKTRRVLRLALVWAEENGLVEKAPVPEPAQ